MRKALLYSGLFTLLLPALYGQQQTDSSSTAPQPPQTAGDSLQLPEQVSPEKPGTPGHRNTESARMRRRKARLASDLLLEDNPHARYYMCLSSAFLFDAEKVSSSSHWLIFENLEYAFSEHWAIQVNTLAFYPISLGLKCAYRLSDDNYIGANVFGLGDITYGNGSLLFGYGLQGRFTKGDSNRNLTIAVGLLGLSNTLFYNPSSSRFLHLSFINAAYCKRIGPKTALNLEIWHFPEAGSNLGGLAVKFIGNPSTCWTVGCYTLLNRSGNTLNIDLGAIPVPYVGVSRKFD